MRLTIIAMIVMWPLFTSSHWAAGQDLLPSIPQGDILVKVDLPISVPATDLVPAPDGSGRMFLSTFTGEIRIIDSSGMLLPGAYMDTNNALSLYSGHIQFTTMALHPDFANPGTPGYGKFYTLEPERAASTPADFLPEFGATVNNHRTVLYEYTADDISSNVYDGAEKRLLFRVQDPSTTHNPNDLEFDQHGLLYIPFGDGGPDFSGNAQLRQSPKSGIPCFGQIAYSLQSVPNR